MAKLNRLLDFINKDTLRDDIIKAEKLLKKDVLGEPRYAAAIIAGIKQNVLITASNMFSEALYEKVEEFKLLNGARPGEGFEDWDAGIDEACENATTPYVDVLSQNWLGTETIDTHIHEEGEFERIVKSFSNEVFKQITDKATGEDIMNAAQVGVADYARFLSSPEVQKASAKSAADAFGQTIRAIADANKGAYDPIVMYDFLDNATDNDDGLSFGATAALMKTTPQEDITANARALQNYRKLNGVGAPQKLLDLIVAAMDAPAEITESFADEDVVLAKVEKGDVVSSVKAGKIEVEKPTKAAKSAKGKAVAKAQKKVDAVVNQATIIPPGVLKDWQEALGNDDTKMAGIIGTSRQSWSNYATGKREFSASEEQLGDLMVALQDRSIAIQNALEDLEKLVK